MQRLVINVTPSGVAGSASGSATASVWHFGELHAVYLDYVAGMTSATTVRIRQASAPSQALLTVAANTADGWFFPRSTLVTAAAGSTSGNARFPVAEALALAVSTSSPETDAVTAYLYIQEQG